MHVCSGILWRIPTSEPTGPARGWTLATEQPSPLSPCTPWWAWDSSGNSQVGTHWCHLELSFGITRTCFPVAPVYSELPQGIPKLVPTGPSLPMTWGQAKHITPLLLWGAASEVSAPRLTLTHCELWNFPVLLMGLG